MARTGSDQDGSQGLLVFTANLSTASKARLAPCSRTIPDAPCFVLSTTTTAQSYRRSSFSYHIFDSSAPV